MMPAITTIIFDLGGTLVDWPDWETAAEERWSLAFDYYSARRARPKRPNRAEFITAMRSAETAHWERVEKECWSGPPAALVRDGFRSHDKHVGDEEVVA